MNYHQLTIYGGDQYQQRFRIKGQSARTAAAAGTGSHISGANNAAVAAVGNLRRKLALRRVLGDIISGGKVVTVPSFSVEDGKTKSFVAAVSAIAEGKKILIIADSFDEMTKRAGRNVAEVLLMSAAEVNVEQLLHANKVVLVESALETIANRTK